MSSNMNGDYIELEQLPVAPPHKSHRWLAVIVIFFLWILFAGGMLIMSNKIYIYTSKANLLGDLAIPMEHTKLDTLHFCGPMLVVKESDRFCIAALWPTSCIFKFDKDVPDNIPIGINAIKPTLAVGMREGIGYEVGVFKKCLNGDISKAERECNGADDVNCNMPGDR